MSAIYSPASPTNPFGLMSAANWSLLNAARADGALLVGSEGASAQWSTPDEPLGVNLFGADLYGVTGVYDNDGNSLLYVPATGWLLEEGGTIAQQAVSINGFNLLDVGGVYIDTGDYAVFKSQTSLEVLMLYGYGGVQVSSIYGPIMTFDGQMGLINERGLPIYLNEASIYGVSGIYDVNGDPFGGGGAPIGFDGVNFDFLTDSGGGVLKNVGGITAPNGDALIGLDTESIYLSTYPGFNGATRVSGDMFVSGQLRTETTLANCPGDTSAGSDYGGNERAMLNSVYFACLALGVISLASE